MPGDVLCCLRGAETWEPRIAGIPQRKLLQRRGVLIQSAAYDGWGGDCRRRIYRRRPTCRTCPRGSTSVSTWHKG